LLSEASRLIDFLIPAKNVAGTIKLLLPRKIRDLLERLNIQKVVEVFDDEEAAIKSFF
jgi:hypothetical protein